MQVSVNQLTPGMVVKESIIGKSNRPIVEEQTTLTKEHILFLQKFLITNVAIDLQRKVSQSDADENTQEIVEQKLSSEDVFFLSHFKDVTTEYKKMFAAWENNVPIEMYEVREIFIPFFEQVIEQQFEKIYSLIRHEKMKSVYYHSVAKSAVSVYLANKLAYKKSDWLQIGFASLLSDCGIAKLPLVANTIESLRKNKHWRHYPIYSYKMVESITTLTQRAKVAILQHRENLDGTGFPAQNKANQINEYARLIRVAHFLISQKSEELETIIEIFNKNSGVKFDHDMTVVLLEELELIAE